MFRKHKRKKRQITLSLREEVVEELDEERKRLGADNRSELADDILGSVLSDEDRKKDVLF